MLFLLVLIPELTLWWFNTLEFQCWENRRRSYFCSNKIIRSRRGYSRSSQWTRKNSCIASFWETTKQPILRITWAITSSKGTNKKPIIYIFLNKPLKVASELNAAILKSEHCEDSTPRVMYLLKMIIWAQSKLDSCDVNYPKMKDLEAALIEPKQV